MSAPHDLQIASLAHARLTPCLLISRPAAVSSTCPCAPPSLKRVCEKNADLLHLENMLEEDFQAWGVGFEAALELEQRLQRAG